MRFGYCERLDGGFWAEPVNAVTNAAFLVAALTALLLWRRRGGGDRTVLVLILLVFAIGIGSFLFHTMPNGRTVLADVVPIQLFAFGYFAFALRRYLSASGLVTAAGTLAFFGLGLALSWAGRALLPMPASGSAGYAAFLLGLFGIAAALPAALSRQRRLLGLAGVAFAVSLTMRSIDFAVCAGLPLGTHWLWHLLNALVLYWLLRAAVLSGEDRRQASGS
ncbi:ceramidase domain-containing protein [Bosea sp. BH3]|uniref:ceramidase domain-containing protein n=1 Tax=Bosea sp. BH3 TaxID=2871701 RepID=UPI0021CAFADB|nr:ceramidase domain-containing protein [Bosea sp. BH3]MCU4180222.1 ceramidase domain-containing protein [Bosea sp. BH3]